LPFGDNLKYRFGVAVLVAAGLASEPMTDRTVAPVSHKSSREQNQRCGFGLELVAADWRKAQQWLID